MGGDLSAEGRGYKKRIEIITTQFSQGTLVPLYSIAKIFVG